MSKTIRIENAGSGEYFDVDNLSARRLGYDRQLWSLESTPTSGGPIAGLIRLTVGKNGVYRASDFGAYGIREIVVKNDGSEPKAEPIEGDIYARSTVSVKVGKMRRSFANVEKIETRTIDAAENATFKIENLTTIEIYDKGVYNAVNEGYVAYSQASVTIVSMYPKNYNGVPYGQYDITQPLTGNHIKAKGMLYAEFRTRYPKREYHYVDSFEEEEFYSAFTIEASFAMISSYANCEIGGIEQKNLSRILLEAGPEPGRHFDMGPALRTARQNDGTWNGYIDSYPLSAPAGQANRQPKRKTVVVYGIYNNHRNTKLIAKIRVSPMFARQEATQSSASYGPEYGLKWITRTDDAMWNIGDPFNNKIYTSKNGLIVDNDGTRRMSIGLTPGVDPIYDYGLTYIAGLSLYIYDTAGMGVTIDVVEDRHDIGAVGGHINASVSMSNILIPITEIEYIGDYSNAPESAKTLSEDDLLPEHHFSEEPVTGGGGEAGDNGTGRDD